MSEEEQPVFKEPQFPPSPEPEEGEEGFHLNGKLVAIGGLSSIAMLGVVLEETMRRRHNANKRADSGSDSA